MNRAAFALLGLLTTWTTSAHAIPDIVQQDVVVEKDGDAVWITIDAEVAFDGPLAIYGLLFVPSVVTIDGAPAVVANDFGQGRLAQWLRPADTTPALRSVHIEMGGVPACRSLVDARFDACVVTDDQLLLRPWEPGGSFALTNLQDVGDGALGSLTVRVPADFYVAAAQGGPAELRAVGSKQVEQRFEMAVESQGMAVAARRAPALSARASNGKHITVASPTPGAEEWAPRILDVAAQVLPVYENSYGALPIDAFRLTWVSGRLQFGGLGLLGTVLINDVLAQPAYQFMIAQGVAHEMAHSWWGGLTSATHQDEGGFLQEAFAEYSAWRALGAVDPSIRDSGVRMNAVWYMTQIDPDRDLPIVDDGFEDGTTYVLVTYHKGSCVLRALEERVGEDAMTAALKALVARGPAHLSVDALAEELFAASGISVEPELQQWLHQAGWPRVQVSRSGPALRVHVVGDYSVPVPVRITTAHGVEQTTLAPHTETLLLKDEPLLVEVDPRWSMVRTVEPAVAGDVSLDGAVDAVDVMEVVLHQGGAIPEQRRQDGRYDPLYDVNADGRIDADDVDAVTAAL